jgi:nicotinamide-nucleotide amidase
LPEAYLWQSTKVKLRTQYSPIPRRAVGFVPHLRVVTGVGELPYALRPLGNPPESSILGPPMKAIILSIGDELVLGQAIDTNSAWISSRLAALGIDIAAHATVADDQPAIEEAIIHAADRCDILLITGGLGPTADDLTRQALAAALHVPLELNHEWLVLLQDFFVQRRRTMPDMNRIQAMIPRGAGMISNSCGTAAGIAAQMGECRIFVTPGVPREMREMFQRDILPRLAELGGGAVILSRTLHTFGLGESRLAQMLGELMDRTRNPSVGTTVSSGIVSLRINARFPSRRQAEDELAAVEKLCRQRLGDLIFGADEQTLPMAVLEALKQRSGNALLTVTTAESCTGGLLAKYFTDVPGASVYFRQGWIVYSDQAKMELLNVPSELLAKHGAVSEPVVRALAANARELAKSDHALAISGVAGPDGGTPDKPVGTVCLALADAREVITRTISIPGDRETIRDRAAKTALAMLRWRLLGAQWPL